MRRPATLAAALVALGGAPALAQSVSPMEVEVKAVSDRVTAQFTVSNPYEVAQTSHFYVVSDRGERIPGARVMPVRQTLGPRARARLSVLVPMEGLSRRSAYVCHAITPRYAHQIGGGTSLRGEVCAKLTASAVR